MTDKQSFKNFIIENVVIETNKITETYQILAESEQDALDKLNDRCVYVDTKESKKILLSIDKTRTIKQAE